MAEAKYRVYHYVEIADNPGNYSLYEDEILTGTVGEWTEATISQNIVNAGYIPPPWVVQEILEEPDFTTHVNIYYNKYYRINYDLRGGTNNPNNPGTYDLTQLPITLQAPTKNGYTFLGWEGSGIENPPQLNHTIESGTEGDLEFTAWRSPVKYRVLHIRQRANTEGYSLHEDEVLEGIPGQYTNAQPRNYPGFYQDGSIVQKIISPDGSTYVRIFYTRYQYTINFDSNGGSPVASITARYGSSLTPPPDPTKSGDTFIGWVPSFPETMPLGGADLVAAWRGVKGIMMNGKYIFRKRAYNRQTDTFDDVQKVMLNGKKIRPLPM